MKRLWVISYDAEIALRVDKGNSKYCILTDENPNI